MRNGISTGKKLEVSVQREVKHVVRGHPLGKPAAFEDRIVRRRIELVRGIDGFVSKQCTLIDIGCGNGASLFLLAGEMASCLGIDISSENESIFEDYKRRHSIRNCEFLRFDIENESPRRTFDRLISFEVIEHLRDEQSVKFYYDVLKDGGLAAITVPNKSWVFETHGANLPLLPWNRVPFFSWLPTRTHEKFANARIYTKKRISTLLRSVGFEIVNMVYVTAPMDVLREGRLKSFLIRYIFRHDTTWIPFFATSIFVLARKRIHGN